MNKAELVEAVAKTLDESKAGAERCVNAVLEGIRKGTKKDKGCTIIGFGTFTVKKRKARTGRNPQTGEAIKIKASKKVAFRVAKDLKEAVM